MHRPKFPLALLALVALTSTLLLVRCRSLAPTSQSLQSSPAGTKSIVLFLLDDQDVRSPMFEAKPHARQIFADEGITFTNAFGPTPICCPGRAGILVGTLGHNNGVLTIAGPFGGKQGYERPQDIVRGGPLRDDAQVAVNNHARTIAAYLERAGYRNGMIGKYLGNHREWPKSFVPPGWAEWYELGGEKMYEGFDYELKETRDRATVAPVINTYKERPAGSRVATANYQTTVLQRKALDFLHRRMGTAGPHPYFLWVSGTAPHLPLAPAPGDTPAPWEDDLQAETLPSWVAPSWGRRSVDDKPDWYRATFRERHAIFSTMPAQEFATRMATLIAVDRMINEVYKLVRGRGELESTVFILTSDNGYNLGAHCLIHKMAPYEESLRVPFYIAGGGIKRAQVHELVLINDLAPTILELAGTRPPSHMDGRSLMAFLRGDDPGDWRADFLGQYVGGAVKPGYADHYAHSAAADAGYRLDVPSWRALRTKEHVFIEWSASRWGKAEAELYDLKRDPGQLTNLIKSGPGAYRELVDRLRQRLVERSSCRGRSCW